MQVIGLTPGYFHDGGICGLAYYLLVLKAIGSWGLRNGNLTRVGMFYVLCAKVGILNLRECRRDITYHRH